jgi:hypothetical protein
MILLAQLAVSAISGSKGGAILTYIFVITLLSCRSGFRGHVIMQKYRKMISYLFVSAVSIGVIVLFVTIGDVEQSLLAFLYRALMSGDAIIYYYQPEVLASFKHLGVIDFIGHELNPILGLFRIVPYDEPIGYQMVVRYLATYGNEELATILGPNAPFYVEGHIYFGLFGGVIYSFILGYFVSFVRKQFFNRSESNIIMFTFMFNLTSFILMLPQDSTLFVSNLFDSMLLTLIILACIKVTFSSFSSSREYIY